MHTSRRLERLGSGVFDRNDQRKHQYRFSQAAQGLPLVDLSLGSTDLEPPPQALAAMAAALKAPGSATYCLHAGTRPLREAVASWCQSRFAVDVDPEREVLLLVGSQEGTAHLPLAVLNPGEAGLILDPSYPSPDGELGASTDRSLISSSAAELSQGGFFGNPQSAAVAVTSNMGATATLIAATPTLIGPTAAATSQLRLGTLPFAATSTQNLAANGSLNTTLDVRFGAPAGGFTNGTYSATAVVTCNQ